MHLNGWDKTSKSSKLQNTFTSRGFPRVLDVESSFSEQQTSPHAHLRLGAWKSNMWEAGEATLQAQIRLTSVWQLSSYIRRKVLEAFDSETNVQDGLQSHFPAAGTRLKQTRYVPRTKHAVQDDANNLTLRARLTLPTMQCDAPFKQYRNLQVGVGVSKMMFLTIHTF